MVEVERRKTRLIQPGFQARLLLKLFLLVTVTILVTGMVTLVFVSYQDKKLSGTLFYVTDKAGEDPVLLKRSQVVLPAILISELAGLLIAFIGGLLYSHKLAGPAYRLKSAMEQAAESGRSPGPISLRRFDEFQDLAEALNRLLARFASPNGKETGEKSSVESRPR